MPRILVISPKISPRILCLLGALLVLLPAPAPAQDVGTSVLEGLQRQQFQTLGAQIGSGSVGETARQRAGGADRNAAAPDLPFASTAGLRAATLARHVRELRARNPAAADEAARELAKHDYDAIFRGLLDGTGLRQDDAGDVLAAFIALQWMVATDTKADPSPAALRALRRQFVSPMAGRPPLSEPDSRAAYAEQVKLRMVLHHAGWQAAQRLGAVERFTANLSREFIPAASLRALALTDEGMVPKARAGAAARPPRQAPSPEATAPARDETPPAAAAEASAPPRHAANWDRVEGVYFRSTTGFGVGGMMILDFEPLILFRGGDTYEIADAALEDVDLAAERIAKPRRFGRWTRSGGGFTLTGASGKPRDYTLQDGSFFKAFPAEAGETLSRGYRRLSGGGNTALGGDVMVAVSSRYDFRADGSYGRGGSVGATNSGASTGVGSALSRRRPPEGGRYALDRHTLTLTGADGRTRRHFFAFGSQKDPPRPDRDMIFVGDDVFSTPD